MDIAQTVDQSIRGNHTAADGALEFLSVRRADRIDALPRRGGTALERERRAIARIGLDDGDVAVLGDPDDLRKPLQPIGPAHPNILVVPHHMSVGQGIAVVGDKNAGSAPTAGVAVGSAVNLT